MPSRLPTAPRLQFVPEEVWLPGSEAFSAEPGVHRVASAHFGRGAAWSVVCTCGERFTGTDCDDQMSSHRYRVRAIRPSKGSIFEEVVIE